MKYRVFIPPTDFTSKMDYIVSDKYGETKEQEALWHWNKTREHDNLRPWDHLPIGTYFVLIEG